jgi:ABC-type lipoprotein release transport system permease subunit
MNRHIRFFSLAITLSFLASVNPAFAAAKPNPLPGVMAADLTTNLENRRWSCLKPQKTKDTTTINCSSKDKTANVTILGTTAKNITSITVNSTTRISYGWPRFIATLPIDGVDPAAAQKWVTSALNAKASSTKMFGDIKFSVVIGSGIARTLTIAHKDTKQS